MGEPCHYLRAVWLTIKSRLGRRDGNRAGHLSESRVIGPIPGVPASFGSQRRGASSCATGHPTPTFGVGSDPASTRDLTGGSVGDPTWLAGLSPSSSPSPSAATVPPRFDRIQPDFASDAVVNEARFSLLSRFSRFSGDSGVVVRPATNVGWLAFASVHTPDEHQPFGQPQVPRC